MTCKIIAAFILGVCVLATVFASASDSYVPSAWPEIHAPKTGRLAPMSTP